MVLNHDPIDLAGMNPIQRPAARQQPVPPAPVYQDANGRVRRGYGPRVPNSMNFAAVLAAAADPVEDTDFADPDNERRRDRLRALDLDISQSFAAALAAEWSARKSPPMSEIGRAFLQTAYRNFQQYVVQPLDTGFQKTFGIVPTWSNLQSYAKRDPLYTFATVAVLSIAALPYVLFALFVLISAATTFTGFLIVEGVLIAMAMAVLFAAVFITLMVTVFGGLLTYGLYQVCKWLCQRLPGLSEAPPLMVTATVPCRHRAQQAAARQQQRAAAAAAAAAAVAPAAAAAAPAAAAPAPAAAAPAAAPEARRRQRSNENNAN